MADCRMADGFYSIFKIIIKHPFNVFSHLSHFHVYHIILMDRKKFLTTGSLAGLAITSLAAASCNNAEKTEAAVDSAKVAVDSAKSAMDTAKAAMDTAKAAMDTAKAKM